jgi:hypothetical protein
MPHALRANNWLNILHKAGLSGGHKARKGHAEKYELLHEDAIS